MRLTNDTARSRVLIVEDDPSLRDMMVSIATTQYQVAAAANAEAALALARQSSFDVLVTDVKLPGMSGIDLIPRITHLLPGVEVIVVSGEATVPMAVAAMKRGALDFLTKPFTPQGLRNVLEFAVTRACNGRRLAGSSAGSPEIIAASAEMQALLADVDAVARFNASVLITGETGTGKELVARRLHAGSQRATGPFVALNCAAVPEQLLEDELFGHVRGAFTGAHESRVGRFEQADGGTLFLDEVADMPVSLQAKLLRVVQERSFERLGSGQTVKVDVRLLAATSGNLEARIGLGTFRADLYYRLNVIRLDLPALRDRPADIAPLASYFLASFCSEAGLEPKALCPETYARLLACEWPGNARQLRNAMERAATMSGTASQIRPENLPRELMPSPAVQAPATPRREPATLVGPPIPMDDALRDMERRLLFDALEKTGGNQLQAARLLGLKRTTFAARLRRARDVDH